MMKNDIRMAAAITLYHPTVGMVEDLLKLKSYFETVYVFDNTEAGRQSDKIKEMFRAEGFRYATKKDNVGLGYALNVCCNKAYKDGFQWIMFLDQDSVITLDLVDKMKMFIEEYDDEKLAVVAPLIEDKHIRKVKTKEVKKEKLVIASGMILKLEAFKRNGYFKTELFLYGVDYEYCLRLYKNGYYILENCQVALQHNQYDDERILQTLNQYKVNKYTAVRYYYNYRWYFYVKEHYPQEKKFIEGFKETNQKWLLGMLCYDNYRLKKLLGIILGSIDYKLGRFGKCRWKILE